MHYIEEITTVSDIENQTAPTKPSAPWAGLFEKSLRVKMGLHPRSTLADLVGAAYRELWRRAEDEPKLRDALLKEVR